MIILGYEIYQVTYTRYIISLTNLSQIIGTLSTYLGYSNWQSTIEMTFDGYRNAYARRLSQLKETFIKRETNC